MKHTSFDKLREAGACTDRYRFLAKALGGVKHYRKDTPIPMDKLLEINGLDDALWALRALIEPSDREIRLLACDFAEHVLPLFESKYPTDKRPRQAIEVARRFANGQATQQELDAARAAAWAAWDAAGDAFDAARAAWDAAGDAFDAARAAGDAAWAAFDAARAAGDAAWAAFDAARAAGDAARAAGDAARAAAGDAAWAAGQEWQKGKLVEMLKGV